MVATPERPPAVEKRSKVEQIKEESRGLRGSLAAQLALDTEQFTAEAPNLLKFHGVYQQEDRDARKAARQGQGAKQHIMMIRSRIPGGALTAEQYLVHDDIAAKYGNNTLRITTREGFQFHGVPKRNLKRTIREINDALVTTYGACGDVVRNVICCPAPVADPVRQEILARARELSNRLLPATRAYYEIWLDGEQVASGEGEEEEPLYGRTYLPRKFKIGLAFPGDNCVDIYSNDLGIVAVVEDGRLAGFNILAGGGMGMTHGMETTYPRLADAVCFVEPDRLIAAVETIIGIQRDHGNRADRKRARLKYLLDAWGLDRFRAELQARLGFRLAPPQPMRWKDAADHLGWGRQGDGRFYLGLFVQNGRIMDTEQVRLRSALRSLIERFRPGIRLTAQQNIILTDIAAKDRTAIEALLRAHGVSLPGELPLVRRNAMACPALPTCGLAMAEAERFLPEVLNEIEAVLDSLGLTGEKLSVRMTGCPNGCARPYLGDIGIVGRTLGKYNIYLGGDFNGTRLSTEFADLVPGELIVARLRPVFALFRDQRRTRERFGDFCNRIGIARLKELAAPATPGEGIAAK